ncbi:MAG TPA: hypothetical protein VN843_09775 [Anaerolineales bacterium]|nr:hypothetical protein [Anaerolineales bacterium]
MSNAAIAKCAEVKILWARACRFDGIDPKSTFVSFSDSNPHVAEYNTAMGEYLKLARGGR